MLHIVLQWSDWLNLFTHYLWLSLLAVGGGLALSPDMHRYLVDEQRWLSHAQFTDSITIAQIAPGPNILFVALIGWNIGNNAGGSLTGMFGIMVTMVGMMLPSSLLTYFAAHWGHVNRQLPAVRAFKQGMGPIVIGLLISTSWIMASANNVPARDWGLWLVTIVTAIIVWRTRIHLLWLLGAGALLGWFGLV
ncbi:MAG: chromate transporter [Pseudomonadota bacterium]